MKRLLVVLLPAYIVYLLGGVLDILILQKVGVNLIFKFIFMGYFWEKTNWYVFEIVICYMVFYFLFKYMKDNLSLIFLILLSLLFILFSFMVGIQNPWYGSTLCFPLGVWYGKMEKNIQRHSIKYFGLKNLVLLLICISCILIFFKLGNDSFVGNPIARNIAATSFSLWVAILLDKISLNGIVFKTLGDISYEIFLIHPIVINILLSNKCSKQVVLLVTIITTLILSYMIHVPIKKINDYIKGMVNESIIRNANEGEF